MHYKLFKTIIFIFLILQIDRLLNSVLIAQEKTNKKPPLFGLPSTAGKHIEQIKAMGNDTWLDLGVPAEDPKWGKGYGRSYLPTLAWAPDLKCAFICGPSQHGMTHKYADGSERFENDLWAYDLWKHQWLCIYPGIDINSPKLKLDEQKGIMTEDGHFIIRWHAYQQFCYDPTLKKFLMAGTVFGRDFFPKKLEEESIKIEKDSKYWAPWSYNPANDEWKLHHTKSQKEGDPIVSDRGYMVYSDKLKKSIYLSNGSLFEFDSKNEVWINHPVKNTAGLGYNLSCYDTKRNRILFVGSGPEGEKRGASAILATLDCEGGEIKSLNNDGLKGMGGVDWMSAPCIQYDATNDCIVLMLWRKDEHQGLYIYDCATDKWVISKKALAFTPPEYNTWSTFYVPELNVHIIHDSGDGGYTVRFLAYRFKKEK